MKKIVFGMALFALTVLVGCGSVRDYTPPADASGEAIFSAACTECHKPLKADVAMVLSEGVANKEALIDRIQSGSMRMPAFKNIQGDAADRLADYILANSELK